MYLNKERKPDIKNQELIISYKGKTYKIVSEGQMAYLTMNDGAYHVRSTADKDKVTLTEEQFQAKLVEWKENCGYGTLETVLGKMTPNDREQWKNAYRFSGVSRRTG